jgi:hypothetical protein
MKKTIVRSILVFAIVCFVNAGVSKSMIQFDDSPWCPIGSPYCVF